MGDAFIVRRGGITDAFAVIAVTYPAGSVCTCTKGSKTLRAKDTSGSFLFMIPEVGTWTVSCTDGTSTKSQNVVISTQYQAKLVSLTYQEYLYKSGEGKKVDFEAADGSLFDNNTYMAGFDTECAGFATQNKVSLSDGQTLYLDAETTDLANLNYSYTLTVTDANDDGWYSFNNTSQSGTIGIIQLKFTFDHVNERKVVSLPITITGDYYIGGGCYFNNGVVEGNGYRVYNLWLE